MNAPAISIIVPTFNAERFIEQTLESVRRQTFSDYEVIVVDDCSTDRTVDLVEDVRDRFDGRIRLIRRETNFGGCAVPRNVGLRLSRGKYVAFLDNDDLLIPTALEMLYTTAESTGADVLHASKWYEARDAEIKAGTRLKTNTVERGPYVDRITVEPEDLSARIKGYVQQRYHWHVWNKFFRRDFLSRYEIEFPRVHTGEDTLFCFRCLCRARIYVRIPTVFYVWRVRSESESHRRDSLEWYVHKYAAFFAECSSLLDEFMSEIELFRRQPEYRYAVGSFFLQHHLDYVKRLYSEASPYEIEERLRAEFESSSVKLAPLAAQAFGLANVYRLQLEQARLELRRLRAEVEDAVKGGGDASLSARSSAPPPPHD